MHNLHNIKNSSFCASWREQSHIGLGRLIKQKSKVYLSSYFFGLKCSEIIADKKVIHHCEHVQMSRTKFLQLFQDGQPTHLFHWTFNNHANVLVLAPSFICSHYVTSFPGVFPKAECNKLELGGVMVYTDGRNDSQQVKTFS